MAKAKPKRKRARKGPPSKLTDAVCTAIIEAMRTGCYKARAIEATGIGETTFYRWMEHGEADVEAGRKTLAGRLWEGVQKAEAEAEVDLVARIRSAAEDWEDNEGRVRKGSWQAAAWLLERKYPARFGRRLELGGEVRGGPGGLDLTKLTTGELQALQELTTKAQRE